MSLAPFRAWEGGAPRPARADPSLAAVPRRDDPNEVGGTGLVPNGNDVRRASTGAPEQLVRQLAFEASVAIVGGCDGALQPCPYSPPAGQPVLGEDS